MLRGERGMLSAARVSLPFPTRLTNAGYAVRLSTVSAPLSRTSSQPPVTIYTVDTQASRSYENLTVALVAYSEMATAPIQTRLNDIDIHSREVEMWCRMALEHLGGIPSAS
jgi:hypothetical protein